MLGSATTFAEAAEEEEHAEEDLEAVEEALEALAGLEDMVRCGRGEQGGC